MIIKLAKGAPPPSPPPLMVEGGVVEGVDVVSIAFFVSSVFNRTEAEEQKAKKRNLAMESSIMTYFFFLFI